MVRRGKVNGCRGVQRGLSLLSRREMVVGVVGRSAWESIVSEPRGIGRPAQCAANGLAGALVWPSARVPYSQAVFL